MHEVTETWEIDGKHHVKPSKGLKKGQSVAIFDTANEAETYSLARSVTYEYTKKARAKVKSSKSKNRKTLLTGKSY